MTCYSNFDGRRFIDLTGRAAIEYAKEHGLYLNKYADPIEGELTYLTVGAAEDIAAEDPALIWLTVELDEPTNLDDLLEQVRIGAYSELEMIDLPIFGGEEPANTSGVWSWDADRLMVGTCPSDMMIVNRGEAE